MSLGRRRPRCRTNAPRGACAPIWAIKPDARDELVVPPNSTDFPSGGSVGRGKEPSYEQLFGLKNDPDERHNLVASLDQATILSTYQTKCCELVVKLAKLPPP
jgi:hypothetical protein